MAGVAVLKDEFRVERSDGEPAFTVDLDGFEGPLDLLLELARRQKVDLARISVLALAEQYLAFVEAAHKCAWSWRPTISSWRPGSPISSRACCCRRRPRPKTATPAELADALAQRLRRLEQIRKAAEALLNRPRLGRDVFARGAPEAIAQSTAVVYEATLYDLLSAYARQTPEARPRPCAPRGARRLVARRGARGADAPDRARRATGPSSNSWLIAYGVEPKMRRTARASSFSASLEMVREGQIELRQDRAFAPLWVRAVRREALARRDDFELETREPHGNRRAIVRNRRAAALRAGGLARRRGARLRRRRTARRGFDRGAPLRGRRRRRGDGGAAAPLRRPRRQSRARRGPLGVPHGDAISPGCWRARIRKSASCRARRSRRSPSSPIISR